MLRTRVIVAIVLIPLVVGCLYLGGIPWLLGVLLAGVLAWLEMAGILQREQFTVDRNLGLFFVVGAIVEAYLHSTFPGQYDLVRPLLAALIIFSLVWALYNKGDHPTADWGVTVASALYLGVTISYLVTLRQRSNGFNWAITAFVVTWACDAMAYFVGRSFGKHKLWPRISPKKTWEGIAGGTVGATHRGAGARRLAAGHPVVAGHPARRAGGGRCAVRRPGRIALQAAGQRQRQQPVDPRPRRRAGSHRQPVVRLPRSHLLRLPRPRVVSRRRNKTGRFFCQSGCLVL